MNNSVIEIRNLSRSYGKQEAVHDLSLTVPAGSCYGFFGRNGAGKTTTIKCLLNLLRPSSGTVSVFGLDPQRNEVKVKSRLAYVPDAVAFYPWMTVRDVLVYFASFRADWNSDLQADLIKRFGLNISQKASALSKGQKTQLALISAICPEPELLILDEPTASLDGDTGKMIIAFVKEKILNQQRCILIVTHDARINEYADRIIYMEDGRISEPTRAAL